LPARGGEFFGRRFVDLNLSNDTIEAKYFGNAGAADWTFEVCTTRHQDRAVNVGLLATAIPPSGIRESKRGRRQSVFRDVGNGDVVALALGGQLRWFRATGRLPWEPMLSTHHVVTFMDGQRFYDVGVRAEVEVIRNSFVYVVTAGTGRARQQRQAERR